MAFKAFSTMDDMCLSKYKKRKMNITLATEEVEILYKVSTKTRKTKQRNENIDGTIIMNRTEPVIYFYFVTILKTIIAL